uniref:Membrane protein n=1 Tax=uncultured Alphaproteobacteria bacterium TaxID=91750 RepID=A0A6G8F434_9PROT|nr:membrane protein [uncultured Alphaproteobacteria bacterium]
MTYMQWMSIGLALVLLEFIVPGTYLVWFGFSAFVMAAVVSLEVLSLTEQVVIFSIVSAVFAVIGLYVYRKIIKKLKVPRDTVHLNDPAAQYTGRSFKLVQDAVDGRSKVAIGDTVWLVECKDGLKAGDIVKITGVRDGVVLIAGLDSA